MPSTISRDAWTATHRLVASFGFPKAVHVWRVMLLADGTAYTRHDWMHRLPPSFRAMNAGAWTYHNPEFQRTTIIKATLKAIVPETSSWRLDNTIAAPLRNAI